MSDRQMTGEHIEVLRDAFGDGGPSERTTRRASEVLDLVRSIASGEAVKVPTKEIVAVLNQLTSLAAPTIRAKPTLDELEEFLRGERELGVEILPSGEIQAKSDGVRPIFDAVSRWLSPPDLPQK